MKWVLVILGGLVGLAVIAFLVLFAISRRPGAGSVSGSVEIARRPEEVWAWLTDPEKQKQWVSWLVEVRDQTPGVVGVGRRQIWVMEDESMSEPIAITSEILTWDPPRRFESRASNPEFFDGGYVYTLTESDGKTRVTQAGAFKYLHPFWSVLEPLVTPAAEKKLLSDLATLKAKAEAEAGESAAASDSGRTTPAVATAR